MNGLKLDSVVCMSNDKVDKKIQKTIVLIISVSFTLILNNVMDKNAIPEKVILE
ncbi:hypothetical protein GK047_08075 [Paenibacillus sp. SYP-B3998]|uniref:Uncharacterized protein n=1 Tax=Paenibacillus sp. SYP-B3998 TaxID=2678564 RepID=A0A6G3ZUS9_9BACL|nr:hypothetical protein [Paenibacillus sp. SYP-B3998]